MESNLVSYDANDLAQLIRSGKVSSADVVQAHLARIAAVDSKLNSIVTVNENALNEARLADEAIRNGATLGPLHGVPFTVKDSIDTANVPTQRGSPIFRGRKPTEDATSVARMKAAGAILIAKTNLPEFSYSTESNNLLSGRTNNPWNLDRTPGGSSGGESAAVAAGLSPLGLGTDLAISVRGPAAQTGIMALKPTHGRIPMTGVWPREPRRFWHVGPMARSVRDLELAYSVLGGPDGQDAFATRNGPFENPNNSKLNKKLKIGWLVSPGFGPIHPQVRATVAAAAQSLESDGHTVEPIRIPALEKEIPLDIFMRIHVNEMQPGFREATQGQPQELIGPIARTMLETPVTSMGDFLAAEQAADRLKDGFAEYFQHYDALLCPVLPIPAHEHDLVSVDVEGAAVDSYKIMSATVPFNVTGLPALSIPFGKSEDGLPIGIQIVGPWLGETTILALARVLEARSPVKDRHPTI